LPPRRILAPRNGTLLEPQYRRLGPYEILGLIGNGGMGQVYRGRDTRLNRDVALKVLPDLVARDRERLARFDREAKVLASLTHPNIAALYAQIRVVVGFDRELARRFNAR
jgi:serine/threonine protein kinase